MATCDTTIPNVDPISPEADSQLRVVERYKELLLASIGENSLYERSKETIFELSKDLNLSEKERMDVVAGQITQMTVAISGSAMKEALGWAKEDAETGYSVALIKAQAEKAKAETGAELQKICLLEAETAYKCAQITSTIAGSIRENGRVLTYTDADECKPLTLYSEGLKYEQLLQVDASKYQILADAYRKSGVVLVGTSGDDQQFKGLSGDAYGHTNAQTNVAHRQITSFEDSKRNHAVNASSQTIGQIVAAEATLDDQIVQNYNTAMNYLLTDSAPVIPGGSANLDGTTIEFNGFTDGVPLAVDTDNVTLTAGVYVTDEQLASSFITFQVTLTPGGNTRNGDKVIVRRDNGEYYFSHTLEAQDITNGYIIASVPSVTFDVTQTDFETYDLESYIQDFAGNKSSLNQIFVSVRYKKVA